MAKEKALHSRTIDLKAYHLHLTSISLFFFFFFFFSAVFFPLSSSSLATSLATGQRMVCTHAAFSSDRQPILIQESPLRSKEGQVLEA